MLTRALAIILTAICLPRICLAAAANGARDVVYLSEDPKCAPGFYPGFESNVWQFTVPANAFINKTGSFQHAEWYLGAINSTQGKDNTIGATRTVVQGNSTITERLVGYYSSPTQSVIRFTLVNGPQVLEGVTLASNTEELRAVSICGGTATEYTMTATYCVDKVGAAYDLYDTLRRAAVRNVANQLGALVFIGTCPIGN